MRREQSVKSKHLVPVTAVEQVTERSLDASAVGDLPAATFHRRRGH